MKNLVKLMLAVSIVAVSLSSTSAEPRNDAPAAKGRKSTEWAVRRTQKPPARPAGQKRPPLRPGPPAKQVRPAHEHQGGPLLHAGPGAVAAIGTMLPKWICPQVKVGDASTDLVRIRLLNYGSTTAKTRLTLYTPDGQVFKSYEEQLQPKCTFKVLVTAQDLTDSNGQELWAELSSNSNAVYPAGYFLVQEYRYYTDEWKWEWDVNVPLTWHRVTP